MHSLAGGWGCFRPIGEILARKVSALDLQNLGAHDVLEFEAPWKETIIVRPEDYLVISLDKTEIYRIALKEFTQTYEQIKG